MIKYSNEPLVSIDNISKTFDGKNLVLDSINLNIYEKEFFSLLGCSGSGKSTLLRILAGFEDATKGKVIIDGVNMSNIPPYKRPVNMMFQSYALFPHMTVKQNIMFGLKQEKDLPKEYIEKSTTNALRIIKMSNLSNRKPHQLSGGQRQRVALARCLAKKPKLILLDEPLSSLDKNLRYKMQFELVNIQEETNSTFMMVTHDQEESMAMSSRIGIMSNGHLEQVSTPSDIYEFPKSKFVAKFIGKITIFEGFVENKRPNKTIIKCKNEKTRFLIAKDLEIKLNQKIWIGIRPEKIIINRHTPENYDHKYPVNCTKGRIQDIAYVGGFSTYYVKNDSGYIIKSTDFNTNRESNQPSCGDEVYLTWDPQNIMVLYS